MISCPLSRVLAGASVMAANSLSRPSRASVSACCRTSCHSLALVKHASSSSGVQCCQAPHVAPTGHPRSLTNPKRRSSVAATACSSFFLLWVPDILTQCLIGHAMRRAAARVTGTARDSRSPAILAGGRQASAGYDASCRCENDRACPACCAQRGLTMISGAYQLGRSEGACRRCNTGTTCEHHIAKVV